VITLAWLVVLVVLAALVREVAQILLARPPARPTSIELRAPRAAPAGAATLPAIIWTYWAATPAPPLIEQCLQTWRRHAPDHEIRLVDRSTVARWIGSDWDAAAFDALPPYRQADWLRLQLLARHGGLWVDASTLLTADLAWVHRRYGELGGGGVVGFYIDRYTRDRALPMIENWFIAAAAGDPFIAAWAAELDRALALGESGYLESLRQSGELLDVAQGIPPSMQAYLLMHLAAGRVSRRDPDLRRMSLVRAEDVAYAYHAALGWRKRHLYARLALTAAPRRVPALIKLRSGDRAVVERGLARGWRCKRSLLTRLLAP
jgi:hypothetical protein